MVSILLGRRPARKPGPTRYIRAKCRVENGLHRAVGQKATSVTMVSKLDATEEANRPAWLHHLAQTPA